MGKIILYEQPLNERVRSFLRLEHLFVKARHTLHGHSVWDSRATLSCVLDILSIFARSDLKAEVLKELERQAANLTRLEQAPEVDQTRLGEILDELDLAIDRLHGIDGQVGQDLRQNEFLSSINQRSAIPGGTCDFDVPAYHYWLQRPAEQRVHDLARWLALFAGMESAIAIILRLIRESVAPSLETARNGFFQHTLDPNAPCQMVRIGLPAASPCYPEISGGKHRFTVRFMNYLGEERPVQMTEDVEFELLCCII